MSSFCRVRPHVPSPLQVTCLALAFAMSVPAVQAQDVNGEALNGTVKLRGGFLPDPHVIDIVPGGDTAVADLGAGCSGYIFAAQPDLKVVLEAASTQLGIFVNSNIDTTLVVNDPNGNWHCNDDSAWLSNSNPGILFENPADGTYDIWVGTYADVGTDGSGRLVVTEWNTSDWAGMNLGDDGSTSFVFDDIDFGDDLSNWANNDECDDPRFTGVGMASVLLDEDRYHDATDCSFLYVMDMIDLADITSASPLDRTQRGRLDTTDPVLSGNGYVDRYSFQGTAGNSAVIDLRSADFDTYLRVTTPSGAVLTNDDFEGSYERSLLSLDLAEDGEYTVEVTSYGSEATGAYTLDMTSDLRIAPVDLQSSGTLAAGDSSYRDGEYYDSYTFEGQPGQTITVDLNSTDFDTYLVLESPDGQREVDDDTGGTSHSQIVSQLSQLGTYTVYVTSYGAAETGAYTISVRQSGGSGGSQFTARDSISLTLGQSTSGSLDASDNRTDEGRYQDIYAFDGSAGDTIAVDLSSGDFDTYLRVITPSGQTLENDDYAGSTARSLVDFTLPETGRYRIVATTYASDATGSYALALNRGSGAESTALFLPSSSGGRVFGIFAGIADYPGEDNDLDLTDQDALRVRDALIEGARMSAGDAYTLIDADATLGNFTSALNRIGAQIGQDDTLVIFYSGHGTQLERAGGPNNTDPDGLDESIVLYDDYLTDDQLNDMLNTIHAGRVLLVFDSCYSGGFAKDVVSAPGRMGLFSSEEDVTSAVAYKFQAGGYLSVFFDDAIRGRSADGDMNRELTAMELSEYLHERFRYDVKAEGGAATLRTAGPEASYQHLVVDRGGISGQSVLFFQ